MDHFEIEGDFITITQLLKALDYIGSGGEAKYFLFDNQVFVNGTEVYEKKKKIRLGDVVRVNNKVIQII